MITNSFPDAGLPGTHILNHEMGLHFICRPIHNAAALVVEHLVLLVQRTNPRHLQRRWCQHLVGNYSHPYISKNGRWWLAERRLMKSGTRWVRRGSTECRRLWEAFQFRCELLIPWEGAQMRRTEMSHLSWRPLANEQPNMGQQAVCLTR